MYFSLSASLRAVSLLVATQIAPDRPASAPASQPPVRSPRVLWTAPLKSHSFGTAAAADVDGDGKLEIAFATYFGDSAVHMLRGRDGKDVWTWQGKQECLDASVKIADVNGDGKLEAIVPVSNSSRVLCLDARTGKQLWCYEAGYGECIDTPPTLADMDGDGKPEILVGTFKGNVHVIHAADGRLVRKLHVAPGCVQSEAIALDCDRDGTPDIVVGNFRGDHRIHAVSGKDGHELWHVQTGDHIYHGPSVGDLDGDGELDLAVGSYDGAIHAFRARDGKLLWKVKPGDRYFMGPTAMVDLDGDGTLEVVCASQRITAIRGDGSTLWSVPADESGGMESVTRGVSVSDLDGDGKPDLGYVNGKGLFRVVRGRDGAVLYGFDAQTLSKRALRDGSSGVTIADLDGDGRLDCFFIVGGGGDKGEDGKERPRFGMAVALTGFRGTGAGWTMMRHDLLNTGNVRTPTNTVSPKRIGSDHK